MKESKADLQEGNQNEEKNSIFCIPAQGHTNPMLPIAAELVRRGNAVRFYSFDEFEKKIRDTGAEFLSCDSFLPKLTEQEEAGLKNVSATEMTVQDIRITLSMNDFLDKEFKTFQPDVVYTDSVCFWGKLNAWKHHVPMAVSTSTFAFNQMSSQYMKNSPKEMADMIFGLPKVSRELKKLEPYGFQVKSVFSLIQSDNHTDSVVKFIAPEDRIVYGPSKNGTVDGTVKGTVSFTEKEREILELLSEDPVYTYLSADGKKIRYCERNRLRTN